MDDTINQAPDLEWHLRVSLRARRARLQIKPYGGLEVVIPPRFPRREVPYFVAQHADWIRHHLAEQQQRRDAVTLPDRLQLAFDNTQIAIVYQPVERPENYDLFAPTAETTLHIEGETDGERVAALRQWIRQRALSHFPPLLQAMSGRCSLEFNRLTIRS